MAAIKRRDAREEVFRLLFETEFHGEMSPEEIYRLAMEDRDFEDDRYIRETYFGRGHCPSRKRLENRPHRARIAEHPAPLRLRDEVGAGRSRCGGTQRSD